MWQRAHTGGSLPRATTGPLPGQVVQSRQPLSLAEPTAPAGKKHSSSKKTPPDEAEMDA